MLRGETAREAEEAQAVIGGQGPFRMVLSDRYLLLMALVILLLNCVNSAGEYILSSIVKQAADAQVAAGTLAPPTRCGASSAPSSPTISASSTWRACCCSCSSSPG